MTQTLTTEQLKNLIEFNGPGHDASSANTDSWEVHAMASELLANREAQPVAEVFIRGHLATVLTDDELPIGTKLYTAPPAPAPAPAVPRVTEIPEAATLTNINQLCPLDNNLSQTDFATGWNDCRQYAITNDGVPPVAQGWHSAAQGWNACRAAMLAAPKGGK